MRVVKIGGRAQDDMRLPAAIVAAWESTPGQLCLVHGGGDEISTLQRSLGLEPLFTGGRRVTTARDMGVIRMALSGTINKRLVSGLISAGVRAVGVSGEDASLVTARPLDRETMGWVGAPERVDFSLLRHLLDGGFLPVISPVSRASTGEKGEEGGLNVNGDDAAAAIAIAAGATELFFMADVDGVLMDGRAVPVLDSEDAERAIASGVAAGGMAAKLQAGLFALAGGVERVRIGTLAALGDPNSGTVLAPARSFA